jgi:hypothetical protein
MTSPHDDRAVGRPIPKTRARPFRLDPRSAAGGFLRGLLPNLLWGIGLFVAVWVVELIVKPHWEYRKAVLAIWCGVVVGPTVFYIGAIVRSAWQERGQKRPPAPAL